MLETSTFDNGAVDKKENLQLTPAVERATQNLLEHFQAQYGSLIFVPLGVNATTTPKKIAPNISESIRNHILDTKNNQTTLIIRDELVAQVFDSFMEGFFNSLNFIAKGVMKALGMKLMWKDFAQELAKHKATNPVTYERRKSNLQLVLNQVFNEVVQDLKTQGQQVIISNGNTIFTTTKDSIAALQIFQ